MDLNQDPSADNVMLCVGLNMLRVDRNMLRVDRNT